MSDSTQTTFGQKIRTYFFRGLGILLPTLLTIYLIMFAYGLVQNNIASPINTGVKSLMIMVDWPPASIDDFREIVDDLPSSVKADLDKFEDQLRAEGVAQAQIRLERVQWLQEQPMAIWLARQHAVERWWSSFRVGQWQVLDLIGLVLAIVVICIIGLLVGNYLGHKLYQYGENLINRLPLVRNIYSSVKQVTDFFFSDNQKLQFSRVIAVQYPRKGLWSVGLVTGDTMKLIEEEAGKQCLTVFVPSSPTPFTGYVITVPREDTIDLPITIEQAIKFAVSGGVLIPENQVIVRDRQEIEDMRRRIHESTSSQSDIQNEQRTEEE